MNYHFKFISFYWCDYMTTVTEEYWHGFKRKRLLKIGKMTVWIKAKTLLSSAKLRGP